MTDKELLVRARAALENAEADLKELEARGWNVEFTREYCAGWPVPKRPLGITVTRREVL